MEENTTPVRINRMQIFEDNVAALRTHVEQYIERGYCVTVQPTHLLEEPRIVASMCAAIGKQLGRPWVHIDYRRDGAWMIMPMTAATKHLRTPILIMGQEVEYATYGGPPVQFVPKKTVFQAYFKNSGFEMLESWKQTVWTDRACRAALNLPALPR